MNPQDKKKTNTAIAVVIAVLVVALFLGGLIYHSNNPVVSSVQQSITNTNQNQTVVNNSTSSANLQNVTQLEIQDTVVGSGATAKAGDHVYVTYVGALTNGQIFDQSSLHGPYFDFVLGQGSVIAGWDQGIVGMKVGGTRELVIPASLAYGSHAVGSIPANSTLLFTVQLLSIGTAPAATATPAK